MTSQTLNHWLRAAPWLVLAALLLWGLQQLSGVLTPFLLGLVLAYIGKPMMYWLVGRKVPRFFASLLVSSALLLFIALLLLLVIPLFLELTRLVTVRAPLVLMRVQETLVPFAADKLNIQLDMNYFRQWIVDNLDMLPSAINWVSHSLLAGGHGVIGFLMILVITPVTMFFLLLDWERFDQFGKQLIPPKWRDRLSRILTDMGKSLRRYLRGQGLVMLVLAIYYATALSLVGLQHGFALGVLTGLLIFVPYLGFTTGCILALLMALLQGSSWSLVLAVGGVYLLGQLLESFLVTPWLVGESLELHPLVVVLVLLAFSQLFGFIGVLLALPVTAVGKVLVKELTAIYYGSDFYQDR